MRDDNGLGAYGIKGLRKCFLMPSPPWTRRTFRHYAECRNVEVVWMGPVMAVVMALVLMLGLEVTVWADEDDDKAKMRDFVAAVYRGQGQYTMAGSIATGEGGVIMKRTGGGQTTTTAGNVVLKPGWSTR
jgi:hypothetical protein